MRRPTRRTLLLVAVGALAAPFLIDWLWTTDEERVVQSLDALQEGFEARDAARIEPWLEPDAKLAAVVPGFPTGQPLLEGLQRFLPSFERIRVHRNDPEISFGRDGDAGAATVALTGTVVVEVRGVGGAPFGFSVTATFRKQPDRRFLLASVDQFHADPGVR